MQWRKQQQDYQAARTLTGGRPLSTRLLAQTLDKVFLYTVGLCVRVFVAQTEPTSGGSRSSVRSKSRGQQACTKVGPTLLPAPDLLQYSRTDRVSSGRRLVIGAPILSRCHSLQANQCESGQASACSLRAVQSVQNLFQAAARGGGQLEGQSRRGDKREASVLHRWLGCAGKTRADCVCARTACTRTQTANSSRGSCARSPARNGCHGPIRANRVAQEAPLVEQHSSSGRQHRRAAPRWPVGSFALLVSRV